MASKTRSLWAEAESWLAEPSAAGSFAGNELDGLPEPACRYLRATIAPGTPLAVSARLAMRGSIKIAGRWLPFRAREVLAPHRGFVWAARVAGGLIIGCDRYAGGQGSMDWRLFGLVPFVCAGGPDHARSAAGRCAGEATWVPTALLPHFGVTWAALDDGWLGARYRLDGRDADLRFQLDATARVRALAFDRWGDPDHTGTWGLHRFGVEVTGHATFDGVRIPQAGRAGWYHGTDRWPDGEFFRYEITALELVVPRGLRGEARRRGSR
jgi:hypothetical protein